MRVFDVARAFLGAGWDCDAEAEAVKLMASLREHVTPSEWRLEWAAAIARQEVRSDERAKLRREKAAAAVRRRRAMARLADLEMPR